MNRCVNCLEKNRGSEMTLKGKNNHREGEVEMKTKVCDKCKPEVIEDMKQKVDKIRRTTKFNSESGFVIYNTKKSELDFIEGNYIEEDSLVIAIRFGELSPRYVTRVRNIGKFIRNIQSIYEKRTEDDRIFDCSKCNLKANVSFKRIWFCRDCLKELESGLQDYLDNHKGEIVSKTI